jgi:hypothetical protein
MDLDPDAASPSPPTGDVSTTPEFQNKLVLAALRNGQTSLLDLSSGSTVSTLGSSSSSSALFALDYAPQSGLIATGSQSGVVSLFDVRWADRPLTSFRRTEGCVNDLAFTTVPADEDGGEGRRVRLLVAGDAGMPYEVSIALSGNDGPDVTVVTEFAGIDNYPVEVIKSIPAGLFAGAKDGVLRRW